MTVKLYLQVELNISCNINDDRGNKGFNASHQ